jgi:hypothetical protein
MNSRKALLLALAFSLGFALFVYAVKLLTDPPEPSVPSSNETGEVIIWKKGQPLP